MVGYLPLEAACMVTIVSGSDTDSSSVEWTWYLDVGNCVILYVVLLSDVTSLSADIHP